jgi:hypothetical protein
MGQSSMAKQIAILDSKTKSKHVDVGQHRATGGEQADFSSSGTRRQRLRDSDTGHGMGQYGGHPTRNYFVSAGGVAVPSSIYTNSFGGVLVAVFCGPAFPITAPIPPISATYCLPST